MVVTTHAIVLQSRTNTKNKHWRDYTLQWANMQLITVLASIKNIPLNGVNKIVHSSPQQSFFQQEKMNPALSSVWVKISTWWECWLWRRRCHTASWQRVWSGVCLPWRPRWTQVCCCPQSSSWRTLLSRGTWWWHSGPTYRRKKKLGKSTHASPDLCIC